MLRIVVVAWLALLASCKSDDKRVAPATNGNKVVEVSGKVSARRTDQPARWLAVGDAVNADDSIETSADGHIVIVLAHNLARWELGPNSSKRVDGSLAWGLPLNDGKATAPEQTSAAAGRHAEKSAAGTTSSAASDEPDFTPKGGTDHRKRDAKAAAIEASRNSGVIRQQASSDSPTLNLANPADPLGGDSGGGGDDKAAVTAKIETPKPDTTPKDPVATPAPERVDAASIFRKRQDEMADCLKGAAKVTIRLRATKGKPTISITGTPPLVAGVKSCLNTLLLSIADDSRLSDASYDFKLEIQKQ